TTGPCPILSAWAACSAEFFSILRACGRPATSMKTATRARFGSASLSSCRRLPCKSGGWRLSPVMFLPGLAKLAAHPCCTGLSIVAMTMGIVSVAFWRPIQLRYLPQQSHPHSNARLRPRTRGDGIVGAGVAAQRQQRPADGFGQEYLTRDAA